MQFLWVVMILSHILGYMASHYDSALFLRRTDKGTILLLLYVDDMIINEIGRASCRERVLVAV